MKNKENQIPTVSKLKDNGPSTNTIQSFEYYINYQLLKLKKENKKQIQIRTAFINKDDSRMLLHDGEYSILIYLKGQILMCSRIF